MNSSSRVKLLAIAFGVLFVGSICYLIFESGAEEEAATKAKDTLGKAIRSQGQKIQEEHPRCPKCGRELPSSGECPFCLMKQRRDAEGKPLAEPPPRLGRYLAWSLVGFTVLLALIHVAVQMRKHRRSTSDGFEEQLKTKCPYCKRRVRFAARIAGSHGSCPTCRQRIAFTPMTD